MIQFRHYFFFLSIYVSFLHFTVRLAAEKLQEINGKFWSFVRGFRVWVLLDAVEFHFHFLVNFISLLVLFSCHFPATKRRIRVLWYSEITTLAVLFLFNRIELVLSVSEDWKRSSKKSSNMVTVSPSTYRCIDFCTRKMKLQKIEIVALSLSPPLLQCWYSMICGVMKLCFSQEGKKQFWIWRSSWTRVFKLSLLVEDKVLNFLLFLSSIYTYSLLEVLYLPFV